MHHDLLRFNKEKLFLRFNGFENYFNNHKPNSISPYDEELLKRYVDEFLSKVEYLYIQKNLMIAIRDFVQLQFRDSKNEFNSNFTPKMIFPKDQLLFFFTRYSNQLILNIPSLLNTINILQDRILRIVGLCNGLTLVKNRKDRDPTHIPLEFAKFFDFNGNVKQCLTQMGAKITLLSENYWKSYGKIIRRYRNIDQHEFSVLYNYGIDRNHNFVVYLPDNPSERDFEKITFDDKIDGITLIEKNFTIFHKYVEDLMQCMEVPEKIHTVHGNMTYIIPSKSDFTDGKCLCCSQLGNKMIVWYVNSNLLKDKQISFKTRELAIFYDKIS